ncbi:MAG: hypothetical protein LBS83_02715 [Holosporales bacterium]|nr:hypothetical protein [Holosporales bacterium]
MVTKSSWGSLPGIGLSSLALGFGKGYLYSFGNWVSNIKIVGESETHKGIVKNFVVGTILGTIQSIPGIALNIWKGGWKLGAQKLGIGFLKGCLVGGINSAFPYIMEKTDALSQRIHRGPVHEDPAPVHDEPAPERVEFQDVISPELSLHIQEVLRRHHLTSNQIQNVLRFDMNPGRMAFIRKGNVKEVLRVALQWESSLNSNQITQLLTSLVL